MDNTRVACTLTGGHQVVMLAPLRERFRHAVVRRTYLQLTWGQRMNQVTTQTQNETFDYVVIGGGSAGCMVAAKLSESPANQVLLLEAGDRSEENPETLSSDGYKYAFINDNLMWERVSTPLIHGGKQRIFVGTGKGIGGSGAVNGMVYTRGSRQDYSEWPKGWQWDDVLPHFEAIEKELRPRRRPPTQWTEACIGAATETGFRISEDLNDGDLTSTLGYEWMNYEGAQRRNSYVGFLKPAQERPNLTVRTHAHTRRAIFNSNRVIEAVEYEHNGQLCTVAVNHEAVFCAGALETPKLLMLSGVGPQAELERHGISLVHDSPNLGENLHDHPNVMLMYEGDKEVDCQWPQLYGFDRMNPDLPLPEGQSDTCFVFFPARSSMREGAARLGPTKLPYWLYKIASIRKLFSALIYFIFGLSFIQRRLQKLWGMVIILGKPLSRGRIRLQSKDPQDQAAVDPAYFEAPEDLETMALAVEKAFAMAKSKSMTAWGNRPMAGFPGPSASRAQIKQWIGKNAITTFHFAGTCRMGTDPEAPVTPDLKLRGVTGVRVADASVVPFTPVSAMNAPSMLVGFRAAEFILATQRKPQAAPQPTAVS